MEPEGDFSVQPISILGGKVKLIRNREIKKVKVQWTHYSPKDVTWELEYAMRESYPHVF